MNNRIGTVELEWLLKMVEERDGEIGRKNIEKAIAYIRDDVDEYKRALETMKKEDPEMFKKRKHWLSSREIEDIIQIKRNIKTYLSRLLKHPEKMLEKDPTLHYLWYVQRIEMLKIEHEDSKYDYIKNMLKIYMTPQPC